MKLQVSERGRAMPASPIRKLMPLADAAKRRGVRVLHLNIGQPDLETPAVMREPPRGRADVVLAYTPSAGTAECVDDAAPLLPPASGSRSATTRSWRRPAAARRSCSPAWRAPTRGRGAGRRAVLHELPAFATMAGVRLVPLTAEPRTASTCRRSRRGRGRCTPAHEARPPLQPQQPDRAPSTAGKRSRRWPHFCREHDLFLIADEVYREFVYDGGAATSVLGLRRLRGDRSSSSTACRSATAPAASGSAAWRPATATSTGRPAHGPGPAVASRPRPAHRARRDGASGRSTSPGGPRVPARRDVLFSGLCAQIPGVFLRKPEGAFYFVARLPIDDGDDFAVAGCSPTSRSTARP